MLVVGLDIGGANLKAATSDGQAADRAFALWKAPERLSDELRSLMSLLPRADLVAVTMTGELADCFPTKVEGVRSILRSVQAATAAPIRVWHTGGEFLECAEAFELPRLVAAANWHALATFCSRVVPVGPALLIDMGSTTTDIIPIVDGCVCAKGLTDLERLRWGELVYTGATRTPLCALGPLPSEEGFQAPLAAEFFATTRDVYLVLGDEVEDVSDLDTADGRSATVAAASARIARMVCADPDELDTGEILRLAEAFAERQCDLIRAGLEQVLRCLTGPPHVLLSGSGARIAGRVIQSMPSVTGCPVTSLEQMFAKHVSRSACAFAVARLAVERVIR